MLHMEEEKDVWADIAGEMEPGSIVQVFDMEDSRLLVLDMYYSKFYAMNEWGDVNDYDVIDVSKHIGHVDIKAELSSMFDKAFIEQKLD